MSGEALIVTNSDGKVLLTTSGSNVALTVAANATVSGTNTGDQTIGGSTGQVQYNNNGVLGGIATTGSGNVVLATSPTLITPVLGAATATSINGATITSGILNGSVTGTNTGDSAANIIAWAKFAGGATPTVAASHNITSIVQ